LKEKNILPGLEKEKEEGEIASQYFLTLRKTPHARGLMGKAARESLEERNLQGWDGNNEHRVSVQAYDEV
jgi:hypothetical protein